MDKSFIRKVFSLLDTATVETLKHYESQLQAFVSRHPRAEASKDARYLLRHVRDELAARDDIALVMLRNKTH